MSAPAPTSTGSSVAEASPANASILSEKVQRALQVRTDTPAMKAALDALAHLPASVAHTAAASSSAGLPGGGGSGSESKEEETVVVDSRSVRVAIEQDALQQALLLQKELQTLVDTVATLRQGVSDTAAIADHLYQGIQADVTVTLRAPPENPLLPPAADDKPTVSAEESSELGAGGGGPQKSTSVALEESQLARTLHDAFVARDQAQQRLTVVQAFLDKFDLSEQDSRLLDHYNFEDVSLENGESSPVNGMAFLKALERVVQIRQALGESFGPAAMAGTSTTSDGGTEGLGASSALRMMESLAQKQEQAYERLYHWLQGYLHLYPGAATASVENADATEDRLDEILSHPFCQTALATLQHVPAFYTHTLELIANARRSQATKQFLLALTSGYGGMPPLEMKAHDAVVYVGDMLAFCFRAFSVEADFARTMRAMQEKNAQEILLGGRDNDDNIDSTSKGGETEATTTETAADELEIVANPSVEPTMSSKETLSLTMSGVARPLKSRILQVVSTLARSMSESNDQDDDLESHDSMMDDLGEEGSHARSKVTQLLDICGLLLFYASAMENVEKKLDLPAGHSSQRSLHMDDSTTDANNDDGPAEKEEPSPLMKAVLECLGEATGAYEATFRVYAAMMDQLSVISGDSEATLAHGLMMGVVKARVESPGFSQDVPCPKEFQATLSLDWALEVIVEASLNTCKSLDDVHMLQDSILKSQTAGLSDTAQTLTQRVHDKEAELIDDLVTRETALVMDLCGLGSMAVAFKNYKEASAEGGGALTLAMAAYPGLSPEEVQEGIKEFYSSLYSPPLPSLESAIKDPTTRKAARRQITQRVCKFYGEIYEKIMAEHENHSGGYDDVSFLGHTPEQVVTLFTA